MRPYSAPQRKSPWRRGQAKFPPLPKPGPNSYRRFRDQPIPPHSFLSSAALPLTPGEESEICFGLLPLAALIRAGHRLRISLAGHDAGTFPRVPAEGTPVWEVQWGSSVELPVKTP